MQRTYEVMFIVRPDMPEEEQERLITTLESNVTNSGGTVKNVERMGKRRMAYVVRKFQDGIYMLMTLEGPGAMVHEEQKRLAKIKAIREARAKRPAAAPAPEAGAPAEAPAATA